MLAETKTEVIEFVHPLDLKFAPFNPKMRTEKRELATLRLQIEKAGEIIVPLIVNYDNFVADGHRRLSIARDLGFESVPVRRRDYNLAELWAILNSGTAPVKRPTWMQAVNQGMPLEYVPERERDMISDLQTVVGKKLFSELAENRKSPYMIIAARSLARYCGNQSNVFVKTIIIWFTEHGMQNLAHQAMRANCPPDVLVKAVNGGYPIAHAWVAK